MNCYRAVSPLFSLDNLPILVSGGKYMHCIGADDYLGMTVGPVHLISGDDCAVLTAKTFVRITDCSRSTVSCWFSCLRVYTLTSIISKFPIPDCLACDSQTVKRETVVFIFFSVYFKSCGFSHGVVDATSVIRLPNTCAAKNDFQEVSPCSRKR